MNVFFVALVLLVTLVAACTNTPMELGNHAVVSEYDSSAYAVNRPLPPEQRVGQDLSVTDTDVGAQKNPLYDLLVAELALSRGHYDIALMHYHQQAHQTNDPNIAALATYLAQQLGDEAATLVAAQHWAQLAPNQPEAQYIAAISLINDQRPTEALHHLKQWRQNYTGHNADIDPELHVYFYLLETDMLRRVQRLDEARALLNEALMTYPQHGNLLYARALISEQQHNYSQMLEDLTQFVRQEPDNAFALNALGYALADQNMRLDEAYNLIQSAFQLRPNSADILDSLGWVEYQRGNVEQAQLWLEQAYRTAPHPEIAAHYGEVLWQLGYTKQAYRIWKQGLQNHLGHVMIYETIERLTGQPYLLSDDKH